MPEHTLQSLRRTFLTGLLILIPLFITYVLVAFLFNLFTGVGAPVVEGLFGLLGLNRSAWARPLVPIVKLMLSLSVIYLLGLIGNNIPGRRMLAAFESFLMRLPIVSSIYGASKQLIEAFRGSGRNFQRVVLVQYPTKGFWMMGFVAAEHRETLGMTPSGEMLAVFIPTTPNPTSGFLVLISPEEVVELNYTVEEAFKFIVSSGIVSKGLTPVRHEVPPVSTPILSPSQVSTG